MEPETAAHFEPTENRWLDRSLDELIDFVLERFHAPLRQELPALVSLAQQVEQQHGDAPNCPHGLAEHLTAVQAAMENHLTKEERILFPMIQAGQDSMVYGPIQVMMQEHEEHGENLKRIRSLTHDLTPPPEADSNWRELYQRLGRLQTELQEHIRMEDQVLFPRATRALAEEENGAYLSGAGT